MSFKREDSAKLEKPLKSMLKIVKKNRKAAKEFKVRLIPTQVFIDTLGHEVSRHIGYFPADSIVARFKAMGVNP